MALKHLVALIDKLPSFRRWAWKRWYQHIARYQVSTWSFMNYGYAPDPPPKLELSEADEPDRYCIQLYHCVASAVPLNGGRILEVGSGRGGGAAWLHRSLQPDSTTGVDFSAKAVRLCQRRHRIEGLEFRQGDAENLPFEDRVFDAVINVESSHCYGSMERFLAQVTRVLRPGGHFLFADFRTSQEMVELDRLFGASGLTMLQDEDITPGVIAAMDLDSERKEGLIGDHVRPWLASTFRQFAGVKGSDVLESFRDGTFAYRRCVLQKQHEE